MDCPCGAARKLKYSRTLQFANIPESFKDNNLSNFKTDVYDNIHWAEQLLNVAKMYVKEYFTTYRKQGLGMYIWSSTKGSGKTRYAVSIANELMKVGVVVKFATASDILSNIRSTWNEKAEASEEEVINRLSDVDVLIIDDFGVTKQKEYVDERFFQIINKRYVQKKATIVTSNLALDSLEMDERIKSRLKEITNEVPFPNCSVRDQMALDHKESWENALKVWHE